MPKSPVISRDIQYCHAKDSGFLLILWHGNTTKKESGFSCGFTAAIDLHIPHYRALGIAASQNEAFPKSVYTSQKKYQGCYTLFS